MKRKLTYTEEQVREAVAKSLSIAQVLAQLGLAPKGGNYRTIKKVFREFGIDTSHFTGKLWNKGKHVVRNPAMPLDKILVKGIEYPSYKLKNRLIKANIKEHRCECCGNSMWMGRLIPLELHHINGEHDDNKLENLQLLCPNCHALTDNYRGKNIKH